ncbi:transcriptional repressor LexA [Persephonella sp.]
MLTKRQREILEFIASFSSSHGYSPTLKEIAKHFGLSAVSTIHEHIEKLIREGYLQKTGRGKIKINRDKLFEEEPLKFPFYGHIAAGKPIEIEQDIFEYIDITDLIQCDNCYALKVKGNSMIYEHIMDGDIIIVENRQNVLNGEVAVVLIDGEEATLKKFYLLDNGMIKLVPANPELEPMYYEVNRVQVQGVVKGIIRSYRGFKRRF